MKIVRICTLLFTFIACIATAARAQDPSNLWYMASSSAQRSYLIQQASVIYGYAGSSSQIGGYDVTGQVPTNHSSADIEGFLKVNPMSVTVANVNDPVWADEVVYDSNWNILFSGFVQTNAIAGKNGYILPVMTNMVLTAYPPVISFGEQVVSAQFWQVDKNTGLTTSMQTLGTSGNNIYTQPNEAGKGYLVIWLQGRSAPLVYDLTNGGVQIQGTIFQIVVSGATIDGLKSYSNPTNILDTVYSSNGVGTNTTYEVVESQYSGKTNYVNVSIRSSEGYSPLGIWVWQRGNARPTLYSQPSGMQYVPVPVNGGVNYLWPAWDPTEFSEPDPIPCYYCGGKS